MSKSLNTNVMLDFRQGKFGRIYIVVIVREVHGLMADVGPSESRVMPWKWVAVNSANHIDVSAGDCLAQF